MTALAGAVVEHIVAEFGPLEMLRRLSDPWWFQAFGCALGFDWHSSGVTTTVCGALKEACRRRQNELGLVVCGGKGAASRRTPDELRAVGEATGADARELVRISRLVARIDNNALQDGYQLYHHTFVLAFDDRQRPAGWAVVQQGMNPDERLARRYHWLSESVASFVRDPHQAVVAARPAAALNLVAAEGESNRSAMLELASQQPDQLLREAERLRIALEKAQGSQKPQRPLEKSLLPEADDVSHLVLPRNHGLTADDVNPRLLRKIALRTYEEPPQDFEQLLLQPGLGAAALRSLALVAELIYNAPASRRDPALYAFAHGGKDGYPYRVARQRYDHTIAVLEDALRRARVGETVRLDALRRLSRWIDRSTT